MRAQFFLTMALTLFPPLVLAQDWLGFRGSSNDGISSDTGFPTTWSEEKNLLWKTALPGPGSSSPVIFSNKIFVTCFTGVDGMAENLDSLKRHLICLDAGSGKILWNTAVSAALPDDPYRGFITQHGYASCTPVTDGERVYVFFGKSGVCAFDYQGKKLWQQSVGSSSGNRKWGSASSPILYKNLVIVNASEESRAVIALDKATGKEFWRAEASRLELSYSTPRIVQKSDGKAELVLIVPGEIWGLDPDSGKLRWFSTIPFSGNISPTLVQYKDLVIGMGGFPQSGTAAVRIGGKGDVTKDSIAWSGSESSYVPSPVVKGDYLYWVNDRGLAICCEAATGKVVYKERLGIGGGTGASRGVYASVVLAGDRMVATTRSEGVFVLQPGPPFKVLAHNRLADDSDFNASPALSKGRIFLRSNKALYCIGEK
ncbi:MAG: serine/threonine protein kinase [Gemmataceae bacterium]|nr:serine/threonine protein kinase [Gemmataceae bacterium]